MALIYDVEHNPLRNFTLYGFYNGKKYSHFFKPKDAFKYIHNSGDKEVFAYNLDYDFQFQLDYLFKWYKPYLHYNRNGLVYVDLYAKKKRIIFKDLIYHTGHEKLDDVAKMFGMKKGSIDYKEMSMDNLKKVIKYNKQDLKIEYELYRRLLAIYKKYGCNKVRATVGSNTMNIYKKNFIRTELNFNLSQEILTEWREAYRGGHCEAIKTGYFKGEFTEIDVNSLFPAIMLEEYPYPGIYYKTKKLKGNERFYLIKTELNIYSNFDVEYLFDTSKDLYYYVFPKTCYPFRRFIKYFNKLKEEAEERGDRFERKVFKLLMNSLYGKFGQLNYRQMLVPFSKIENYKNKDGFSFIRYSENIYRVWYETKYPYWTNFIWSLFTTSRARYFLFNALEDITKYDLEPYYCDTDSIIFKGNTNRIKHWIDKKEIGKWKVKKYVKNGYLYIKGKKCLDFNGDTRAKGVPLESQEEFINNDVVVYNKFVRIKEKIKKKYAAGTVIQDIKTNRLNKC